MRSILKIIAVVFALALATQGCAVFLGDEDGFHHGPGRYHEHWGREHSSVEPASPFANQIVKDQMAE